MQFIEQRLGLLQIERVETFGEPAIDRSEQFASLLRLPFDPFVRLARARVSDWGVRHAYDEFEINDPLRIWTKETSSTRGGIRGSLKRSKN